jgi:hypothetical protein
MSTLGISVGQRVGSRISFYLLLGLVMWTTNRLLPNQAEWERKQWAARGVVQPLIGVPVEDVPKMLNAPGSR